MAWPFKRKATEEKAAPAVSAGATVFRLGGGSFMARSAEVYAKEGYAENVIAFACIHKIAQAVASVALQLQQGPGGDLIDAHSVLDLLGRPNPINSGSDFFYALVAWRLIAGEAFIVRSPWTSPSKPAQLWLLEPHRVKVNTGLFGMPTAYEYTSGNTKLVFPVDPLTGASDVLHLRQFNPLNLTRGLSPMSAAAYSIDTHNAAMRWNKALLDNAATPSGAFVMKQGDGSTATLTDEQFARVNEGIVQKATGPANARKPLLLEGGLEWQSMSFTPAEMDWNNGIWAAATHICAAFQVPPQMVGIPGSQTFANFEQATLTFWTDVAIPMLESILDGLNRWLVPMYGDPSLYLAADQDTISALEPTRQIKYDRANASTFLTLDEKREMTGYDKVEGGDVILVSSTMMPLDMVGADLSEPEPQPSDDPASPDPGTEAGGKQPAAAPKRGAAPKA